MDMKPEDFYWLVGILEGEGCFMHLSRASDRRNRSPIIALSMTDLDVVEKVASLLGTHVWKAGKPKKANHKQCYTTAIRHGRALHWMKQLLPHMGQRRAAKIVEIISEYENSPERGDPPGTPECHPTQPFAALGKCQKCYDAIAWQRRKVREAKKAEAA